MAQQPMRIVFLDRETISPQTVLRPASFPHELVVHQRTDGGQVAGRIAQADIVITNKRSEEHTSELQSLMRISYAVFCLKKKKKTYLICKSEIIINITTQIDTDQT